MNKAKMQEIMDAWKESNDFKLTPFGKKSGVTGSDDDYILLLEIKRKDGTVLEVPIQ